jgi:hypothetical protein
VVEIQIDEVLELKGSIFVGKWGTWNHGLESPLELVEAYEYLWKEKRGPSGGIIPMKLIGMDVNHQQSDE